MPGWLISFIIGELTKYLTPELIARLESQAKQFVVCELVKLAKDSATPFDDVVVAQVAAALGVDVKACPV